jgi:hydroxymethylglutaryl-CoA synthase
MATLTSYGAYVPQYRAPLGEIQKFFGRPGRPRSRALATPGLDEDTLTMAFEAARDALKGERGVGAVITATQAPPFGLRKLSATLSRALRLDDSAVHIDLGANATGLLDAFRIAATLDVGPTLVVASDHLVAYRDRVADVLSAGAATAFVIDPGNSGFAELGPQARAADEVFDVWLLGREQEPRFRMEVLFDAYGKTTGRAAKALEAITERDTGRYTSVCPSQPHPQVLRSLGRLGVKPEQIEGTSFVGDIGNLGAASVGLALCLGLDASKKGSNLLALAYGGGEAVAQEIRVTAKPKGIGTREMIEGGEPIALGTYYRWTEGRQQQPH